MNGQCLNYEMVGIITMICMVLISDGYMLMKIYCVVLFVVLDNISQGCSRVLAKHFEELGKNRFHSPSAKACAWLLGTFPKLWRRAWLLGHLNEGALVFFQISTRWPYSNA